MVIISPAAFKDKGSGAAPGAPCPEERRDLLFPALSVSLIIQTAPAPCNRYGSNLFFI
nr:MAG TPA: hypothetical protein [Caudoviricetes sp.]